MKDESCLYYIPVVGGGMGICGPAQAPDGRSLITCDRCAGCGYEPKVSPAEIQKVEATK